MGHHYFNIKFWFCVCLVVTVQVTMIRSDASDPCQTAINIGDKRRSTSYVPSQYETLMMDSNLDSSKWYKFDSCTGSKMPESCPAVFHCGTYAPVWLNGVHPTASDPGPKTIPVCAPYYPNNCCGWSSQISVKRCQDSSAQEYFVYQLQTTPEYVGYCAGTGVVCGSQHAWNTINSTCTAVPVGMTDPVLGPPYISATKQVSYLSGSTFNATRFSINCNIGYPKQTTDDGVRFVVSFQADGVVIGIFTAASTNPSVALDESYLRGHLGTTITCSVQSYVASTPCGGSTYSRTFLSNGYWIGLQPVDASGSVVTTVTLQQGQNFTFRIRSTFPITLGHCFASTLPCFPSYQFQISATSQNSYDCNFILNPGQNVSDPIVTTPVTVNIIRRNIVGSIDFLRTNNSLNTIFQNYKIQRILVQIYDPLPQPQCTSWGDPHIRVFGASSDYNIYELGNFYLLKARNRLFEIQVRHVLCYSSVSCNCGVIVREGNNILGINACDYRSSPLVIRYLLDANFPSGTVEWTGTKWTINLISGIKITAEPWSNNLGGNSLNLEVFGLNSENYDGLCANTTSQSTEFASLRVPDSQSFFNFNATNPPQCANVASYLPTCNCTGKNDSQLITSCNQTLVDYVEMLPVLLTGYTCTSTLRRRRRSTDGNDVNIIDLNSINARMNHTNDNLVYTVNPTWPTPSGITQQQARDQCNTVLRSSPAYQTCRGIIDPTSIINTCVVDIQLMDKLSAVSYAASILEKSCIYTMKSQITETENGVDAASVQMLNTLNRVQNSICPSQCSGRGTCSNQKCTCNSGYLGDDCSIAQGQQPTIKTVISAQCDIRQSSCRTVYLEAMNVLNSSNLVCQIQPLGGCNGGNYFTTKILNGSSTPYGPTLCSTLLSPVSWLANGASIYIVKVSLSNDGAGWSNSLTYTVYDSHCFTCDNNGCQKQTSFTSQVEAQRCDMALSYGSLCNFDNNNYCVPNSCTSSTTLRSTPPPPISCWEAILNSNVPYGIRQPSARNLADCQNQCLAAQSTSCPHGFDFNPSNQPGDQCFFSTSNDVQINSYPGVVHYRYTCTTFAAPTSTTPTTTPPTTTPPTSTPHSTPPFVGAVGCWKVFDNSNSPGGTAQQFNTLADCKINCFLNSCIGFDWNPQNPSGQQCWFSTSDVINYNSYSGCTHYQRKPCL